MRDPDAPAPDPVLNAKAKHYERQLHKIFAVDTASIWLTWNDWKTAETQVTDLAKAVRTTKSSLQAPTGDKPWSGPAADAAYTGLDRLSTSLDERSRELGDVKASLDTIYKAVNLAKEEFSSKVNSISTYVDPAAHQKLPAGAPKPDIDLYGVPDDAAIAAAEDAKWEERNQAAKVVLDSLGADTETASAKMPIDATSSSETPYSNNGPAASNTSSGTASQSSTSGGFLSGGHAVVTGQGNPVDTGDDDETVITQPPTEEPVDPVVQICTGYPHMEDPVLDPISSDGPVTGSTGVPTGTGPGGSTGTFPTGGTGGGGVSGGGIAAGGLGGVGGLAGMLGNRGGGGMFSSGGAARGGAGGNGARGSAMRAGAVGRTGGAQVVPGGGGASARGGASGRGSAVKGATGSGRYGVPKLGNNGAVAGGGGQAGKGSGAGKGAGTGKAGARGGGRSGAAMGAGGSGGGRKGDKKGQVEDVDKLTHEDEEKWFEGTEESSPQVWE